MIVDAHYPAATSQLVLMHHRPPLYRKSSAWRVLGLQRVPVRAASHRDEAVAKHGRWLQMPMPRMDHLPSYAGARVSVSMTP